MLFIVGLLLYCRLRTSEAERCRAAGCRRSGWRPDITSTAIPAQLSSHKLRVVLSGSRREAGRRRGATDRRWTSTGVPCGAQSSSGVGPSSNGRHAVLAASIDLDVTDVRSARMTGRRSHCRCCMHNAQQH